MAQTYLDRVTVSDVLLKDTYEIPEVLLLELNTFSQHAVCQIDQNCKFFTLWSLTLPVTND
ncbi:MAG: hypothetical protein V3U88_07000 [Methylococcales bacterium]